MRVVRVEDNHKPRVENDTIVIINYPTSAVAVETETFVACNYLGPEVTWWFFIDDGDDIVEVGWNDLLPSQQLQVRTSVIAKTHGNRHISFNFQRYPYSDERCELLEALI